MLHCFTQSVQVGVSSEMSVALGGLSRVRANRPFTTTMLWGGKYMSFYVQNMRVFMYFIHLVPTFPPMTS